MNRIYLKDEFCIGCGLCRVHCQVSHSKSNDILKTFKKESTRPVARLRVERKSAISFAVMCRQCREPHCVYACLTGALQRDSASGIITVDTERCIGCGTCILACPFGAISQDKDGGRIVKCDLCTDKSAPACVANCPNEALVYMEVQDNIN